MKLKIFVFTLIIANLAYFISCDSVCTTQNLISELVQDVADNGKLDCLRKPLPPPKDKPELPIEKKKRLEGAWDTDCAFEADYDWLKITRERFGLKTGLVDRDGKAVDNPFDGQADMCELVRAMIAGGIFEGTNLSSLNEDSFSVLDCPGPSDQSLQICAATSGAASQKYGWIILLEPTSITIKDSTVRPQWELEEKSKEAIDARKNAQ